jgi:hypothetical protein
VRLGSTAVDCNARTIGRTLSSEFFVGGDKCL